ncbi:hypothetical protein MSG28_005455 [Choristoneura fumiferana]|uniref:Uncharacterized protein n=1 Tax=Choristoneura fumiferana TaxID=7141 RepID=A0ACC0KZ63_CHOFU|nr:hypothetical protein MSG28_005455 [Choristoneura fumiferana]
MATLAQIILIIACAYFVDCRYMGRQSHKQSSPTDHQATTTHTIIKDFDAVIFPRDDGDDGASKNVEAMITNNQKSDLGVNNENTETKADVPLLSKVPVVEVKDIFTNAAVNKEMVINENIVHKDAHKETDVKQMATTANGTEIKVGNSVNSNKTEPDLSTRFGGTSDYMLVPVANNQNYQLLQTTNVPYYNTQGVVAQAPANTVQYGTSIAPNIGSNQFISNTPIQYPASNIFNPTPTNTNTYVPVNTQNTYMINGQLYAAVTAPNNLEVLSPLYFVSPPNSGYQVLNNAPMYKLVTVSDGSPQV